MKCASSFHPEYNSQECLCISCFPIDCCVETPCAVCEGPVIECDAPNIYDEVRKEKGSAQTTRCQKLSLLR